ncbi:hypothetical protein Cantr_00016 [Candida viswanathii]|uniref:Uncharacterized protein n=1 Tax=Candida viswanathii TaxID=5486 RepID=A0A367YH85_9ASCO|nr:hypothetical protein Cantr_00016 [Candida viswanathii]
MRSPQALLASLWIAGELTTSCLILLGIGPHRYLIWISRLWRLDCDGGGVCVEKSYYEMVA